MKTKVIERQIKFEAPNTLGLNSQLWNKQQVGAFARDVVFYIVIMDIALLGAFLLLAPRTVEWILVVTGIILLVTVSSILLRNFLVEKSHNKHLDYRSSVMPDFTDFLATHGYVISETEQKSLTTMMKRNFQVVTIDGVTYRTSGLMIDDNEISAIFYLSDGKVDNELRKAERADRIERIVSTYEKEHGEFASPEIREAFTLGLCRGLR